jgi:multiple sugar transport system substrate-binding protein
MTVSSPHRAVAVAAGLSCLIAITACSPRAQSPGSEQVRFTFNCEMPASDPVDRANLTGDMAAFEKLHPGVHITPTDEEPCDDPKTFDSKLANGTIEDVFYLYDTDVAKVIAHHQAADITPYLGEVTGFSDLRKDTIDIFTGPDGHVYGLPMTNYTLGLVYDRDLFAKAGLDPNSPPTNWEQVREDAAKISALGGGTIGYADYSAGNEGGWHFTAELYSRGGSVVTADGKHAAFDDERGHAVLANVRQMRWTDNSMGTAQKLTFSDVGKLMGAGKLGMYLAPPDNIMMIVKQDHGSYQTLGIGPMPGGQGTLLGGDGYMIKATDTPAQVKAAVQWLAYDNLTPGTGQFNWQRFNDQHEPVGMPEPDLWTGRTAAVDQANRARSANVPLQNYKSYLDGMKSIPGKLEPPHAQQIYAVLDPVMAAVLTDPKVDVDSLLRQAAAKVDDILAGK